MSLITFPAEQFIHSLDIIEIPKVCLAIETNEQTLEE